MSMNVTGGAAGDGVLYIAADNEGLDSKMHLTINGGRIRIESGNDGINTNEDGVSVTTVNGGELEICVTGDTGEGDGIDSNGWLVINGGTVRAWACGTSADSGIDSDMGIYLNGGSITAGGNMLDRIEGGSLTYAVFSFASRQTGGSVYRLKNAAGETVFECTPENDFTNLIIADAALVPGDYTLWQGDTQLAGASGAADGAGGFPGGFEGMAAPEGFEGMTPPEGMGQLPEGFAPSDAMQPPGGMELPEGVQPPSGMDFPGGMQQPGMGTAERSTVFTLVQGGNSFMQVGK